MRGHNICFPEEILKIIPKLSLLLLLIWSPAYVLVGALELVAQSALSKCESVMRKFLCDGIGAFRPAILHAVSCPATGQDGKGLLRNLICGAPTTFKIMG